MKDLEPNILNDYEHRIARIIEHYGDEETFPRMGLLLALMAKGVRMLVTRYRLSQLRREQKAYAQYADAVDQYLMDKTM